MAGKTLSCDVPHVVFHRVMGRGGKASDGRQRIRVCDEVVVLGHVELGLQQDVGALSLV